MLYISLILRLLFQLTRFHLELNISYFLHTILYFLIAYILVWSWLMSPIAFNFRPFNVLFTYWNFPICVWPHMVYTFLTWTLLFILLTILNFYHYFLSIATCIFYWISFLTLLIIKLIYACNSINAVIV